MDPEKCRYGRKCTAGAHVPEKEGIKMRQDQDFFEGRGRSPGRGRGEPMVTVPISQVRGRGASARGFGSH